MSQSTPSNYRFEVALSFAGDNKRDKVRLVAEILRSHLGDGKVFLDEWFEAELAGHDAQVVLGNIYRNSTRLVVTCVCKRYGEKPWTQDEWRAIQAFERQLRDAGADNIKRMRFMPLRFGDGELDGIFETAIVPDVRQRSPAQIAELILERLRLARSELPADQNASPDTTPGSLRTTSEVDRVLQMLLEDTGPFLVGCAGNAFRWILSRHRRAGATAFKSFAELHSELVNGNVRPDSIISFPARMVSVGPFNRAPYLMPIIGTNTNQRLGPQVVGPHPVLAVMAQMGTHWSPVGLFPSPAPDLFQGTVCGPEVRVLGIESALHRFPTILTLPLIAHRRLQHRLNHASVLTGTVRLLSYEDVRALGISVADVEALRNSGGLWFLDMTGDEASASDLTDGCQVSPDLWGALYACGHFEFEKAPDRGTVIDALVAAFRAHGLETTMMNDMLRGDVLIAARGVRLTLGGPVTGPIFSLHRDVELLQGYALAHNHFKSLLSACLHAAVESFEYSGTHLLNPNDVDFTYIDAEAGHRVLRSMAAEQIVPVAALAIRDWHRQRGSEK